MVMRFLLRGSVTPFVSTRSCTRMGLWSERAFFSLLTVFVVPLMQALEKAQERTQEKTQAGIERSEISEQDLLMRESMIDYVFWDRVL